MLCKANDFQIDTCIYMYINSMIEIVLTHQKVLQNWYFKQCSKMVWSTNYCISQNGLEMWKISQNCIGIYFQISNNFQKWPWHTKNFQKVVMSCQKKIGSSKITKKLCTGRNLGFILYSNPFSNKVFVKACCSFTLVYSYVSIWFHITSGFLFF